MSKWGNFARKSLQTIGAATATKKAFQAYDIIADANRPTPDELRRMAESGELQQRREQQQRRHQELIRQQREHDSELGPGGI